MSELRCHICNQVPLAQSKHFDVPTCENCEKTMAQEPVLMIAWYREVKTVQEIIDFLAGSKRMKGMRTSEREAAGE